MTYKTFFDFIRSNFCIICGGVDTIDKYGEPRVTVSHVLPRGSQRRNEHFDNAVPMCISNFCHQRFELLTKKERLKYLPDAIEYTRRFKERG